MNPNCFLDHTTIKEILKSVPEEDRKCPNCGEVVMIRERVSAGFPFDKAAVAGCDRMIDKVIELVKEEGLSRELDFADCFEQKKSVEAA